MFKSLRNFFIRLFGGQTQEPTPIPKITPTPAPAPVSPPQAEPAAAPIMDAAPVASAPTPVAPKPAAVAVEKPAEPPAPVEGDKMRMGDYDYVFKGGAWEIDPGPEAPVVTPRPAGMGIGVSRLPNGAIYQGRNRYGLPSASQQRVYEKAMELWKSRSDDATLTTILSRITEPWSFDPQKYPDLQKLVDAFVVNDGKLPAR